MQKNILIGVSICAVVLFVLVSLTNVVGYQMVQSSNQKVISDEIDQKELLFQTIVDIANNKGIQQVILKSQITKDDFLTPDMKVLIFNTPLITKSQLKQMYVVGLILSKAISKTKLHSLIERYQVNNQWMQKEITAIIEKDTTLNGEMTQLSYSKCDCEDSSAVAVWHFPAICAILAIMLFFLTFIVLYLHVGTNLFTIIGTLFSEIFKCNEI